MTTDLTPPTLWRRIQPGRLLAGAVAETVVKAYGVGAVAAVAVSDAETVGGKAGDAVAAVPTLVEEYQDASYLVDNREEIQDAIAYLDDQTVPQEELQRQIDQSGETLGAIDTTFSEVGEAREALGDGRFPNVREAIEHVGNAFDARPEIDSLRELAATAQQVRPLLDEVEVLTPAYYAGIVPVADNFARDEVVATLCVMGLALLVAAVLGRLVGFWIRRGQPGFLTRIVHGLGVRAFPRWYAGNVPFAMAAPLYAAARGHAHRQLVADPEAALDEETFRELEEYFARRSGRASSP